MDKQQFAALMDTLEKRAKLSIKNIQEIRGLGAQVYKFKESFPATDITAKIGELSAEITRATGAVDAEQVNCAAFLTNFKK